MDHRWWRANVLLFDNCLCIKAFYLLLCRGNDRLRTIVCFLSFFFNREASCFPIACFSFENIKSRIFCICCLIEPLLGISEDASKHIPESLFPDPFNALEPRHNTHLLLASQEMFLIWDASGGFAFKNCQEMYEGVRTVMSWIQITLSWFLDKPLLWWWIFVYSLTHWFPSLTHSRIYSLIHFIFNSLFHSVNQLTAFLVGGPAGLD